MKKIINVYSIPDFEFWVNIFKLRSKKWQTNTLKRLKQGVSCFETDKENSDKIKALNFLLNK